MKHKLTILFTSLTLIAVGLGFFNASSKERTKVNADGYTVTISGDQIKIGSYPQKIVTDASLISELNSSAVSVDGFKYQYGDKYYSVIDSCRPFSGGDYMNAIGYIDISFTKQWFEWSDVYWRQIEVDGDVTYFYAQDVIDVSRYQSHVDGNYITGTTIYANDYENSTIRNFLNNELYNNLFNEDEKTAAIEFTNKYVKDKATTDKMGLLNKETITKYSKFEYAESSLFAVSKSVRFELSEIKYTNYYLCSTDNTTSHTEVDIGYGKTFTKSKTVNETTVACEIGVRPFIAIDNSKIVKSNPGGHGGGGGVYINIALIIGIILSILGVAGLTCFFIFWRKGKLVFTFKYAPLIIICVIITFTCVGLAMTFANTGALGANGGGGSDTPVGYWGTTDFTLDVNSPDFGFRYFYALSSDHSVYRYKGEPAGDDEDTVSNFKIRALPGVGYWQVRGNRLVITASESWQLFEWEELETKYYTVKHEGTSVTRGFGVGAFVWNENGGQTQKSYEIKGYRWSHSSYVDSHGENTTTKEAGLYRN